MNSSGELIRAWAQRLLAAEAANKSVPGGEGNEMPGVLEKLRNALTQFVGADGFTALMRRSLALARAEAPSLQSARVNAEGRLEGIGDPADGAKNVEAVTAITVHLLGLLVTFIGEPITLRLLRDLWPDESSRTTINSEDL